MAPPLGTVQNVGYFRSWKGKFVKGTEKKRKETDGRSDRLAALRAWSPNGRGVNLRLSMWHIDHIIE